MIQIQRQRESGATHTYTIYEAGDVVPATVRLVPYAKRFEAMSGEYVEDINGRFVPLLRRICINKQLKHHNMIFPGFTWQPWKNVMFSYSIEKGSAASIPQGLRGKDILVAKLIEQGLDAEACVRRAYPTYGRRQIMSYLTRMFMNQKFIQYLFVELGFVKKLKKALENKGVTVDRIAEEIDQLLSDERSNPTLRRWALETALAALESQDKSTPIPQIGANDAGLDEIMQQLIGVPALKELPSTSTEA